MKIKDVEYRKQQIFNAVQGLIKNTNFNKLTITDFAKAANLSRKTIYTYFKSRDEILLEMYTENIEKRYHYLELGTKSLDSLNEKLYRIAQVSYNYFKKDNASLFVHIYWGSLMFDFSSFDPSIVNKFREANKFAHDFLFNVFKSSEMFIESSDSEIDYQMIFYLDSIHNIIKRAILEPEFWAYEGDGKDYFDKSISSILKIYK
jgi:AcrR family transcriptional regulator